IMAPLLAAALALTACSGSGPHEFAPLSTPPATGPAPSPTHPNIVFVLTDDLTANLVTYMPHVRALMQAGMSFSNYTVTDSLCCPSRASIFSGRFPHDTHIYTNTWPRGGFVKFHDYGEEANTFATTLHAAGYRTAFMGKYLNGYQPQAHYNGQAGAYVPAGWSTWNAVGARGYDEFRYTITDGHASKSYGAAPRDYLTTVLDHNAVNYVRAASTQHNPFLLEVATFAPHLPYVPAPADLGTFSTLREPHTPAFNRVPSPAPRWMVGRRPLTGTELRGARDAFDLRVESVQSVDRMVGHLETALQKSGQAKNTLFVFSSDNGYHLGEYTLALGKQTAFDTDIHVPLVIAGPGIPAGVTNSDVVENIDLRPTFEELAGAPTPAMVDGRSLVPLLHGQLPAWREVALVEHHHPRNTPTDPDAQNKYAGDPPTYTAIRTPQYVYVRYVTGDREYYNLVRDRYELHNLGPSLSQARVRELDRIMNALVACHDGHACWRAGLGDPD
ncbi:MAG: sulfatase family protein, partial [Jatrophihabitantaceae bacterium]